MKVAHFIMIHRSPQQIERLLKSLNHNDAKFYIHVDKKADITQFLHLQKTYPIKFTKNRVSVAWGTYSVVEAMLNGISEIIIDDHFDYINTLSGQDYPIKKIEDIHQFLSKNTEKGYIHFETTDEWAESKDRFRKYDFGSLNFPGKYALQKFLNLFVFKRTLPNNLKPYGRSQWFTLTPAMCKYVLDYLDAHANVKKFFKLSWGADETLFQTILCNSHFKNYLINDNQRYIDWSEKKANPKVLKIDDTEAITKSNKLFARKFDEKIDSAILDYIDQKILS